MAEKWTELDMLLNVADEELTVSFKTWHLSSGPLLHPGNRGKGPGAGPEAAHIVPVLRFLSQENYSRTPLAWQLSLKNVGKPRVRQRPLLFKYHRIDPSPGSDPGHAGLPVLRLNRERASWPQALYPIPNYDKLVLVWLSFSRLPLCWLGRKRPWAIAL